MFAVLFVLKINRKLTFKVKPSVPFPIYCTKRAMPSDGIPGSGQNRGCRSHYI